MATTKIWDAMNDNDTRADESSTTLIHSFFIISRYPPVSLSMEYLYDTAYTDWIASDFIGASSNTRFYSTGRSGKVKWYYTHCVAIYGLPRWEDNIIERNQVSCCSSDQQQQSIVQGVCFVDEYCDNSVAGRWAGRPTDRLWRVGQ